MTNYFQDQGDELCFVSVQDVKDSLGAPIDQLSDEEIEALIIASQNAIKCYFKDNAGFIPVETDCGEVKVDICSVPCDEIPVDIRRATLLVIEGIYEESLINNSISQNQEVKKESSCGTSIEYFESKDGSTNETIITPQVEDLLCKYTSNGFSLDLFKTCCYKDTYYANNISDSHYKQCNNCGCNPCSC